MYSQKPKTGKSKKMLIGGILAALVIVGIGLYIFYRQSGKPTASTDTNATTGDIDYSPATEDDNKANEDRKNNPPPSTSPSTPPGATSPAPSTFSVNMTGANVQAGNVHIGTLVSGTTSGNCVLTASQPNQAVLQLGTSSVQRNVNTYDCGVFNIPIGTFPTPGNWQLNLTVTSGSEKNSGTYDVIIP